MTGFDEAIIDERGQVVIPESIRDEFELRPGTTVQFVVADGKIVLNRIESDVSAFLNAIEKRPEPTAVDWDERYAERFRHSNS